MTRGPVRSTRLGQGGRSHGAVQSSRPAQFDQHDVAVLRAGAVVGMADELGRHDVLFRAIGLPKVVLSQSNFNV